MTLRDLERRVDALEELALHCSDPRDREADRLLRQILHSIRATLWLLNGAAKFAPLIGVLIAIWLWGGQVLEWVRSWLAR